MHLGLVFERCIIGFLLILLLLGMLFLGSPLVLEHPCGCVGIGWDGVLDIDFYYN